MCCESALDCATADRWFQRRIGCVNGRSIVHFRNCRGTQKLWTHRTPERSRFGRRNHLRSGTPRKKAVIASASSNGAPSYGMSVCSCQSLYRSSVPLAWRTPARADYMYLAARATEQPTSAPKGRIHSGGHPYFLRMSVQAEEADAVAQRAATRLIAHPHRAFFGRSLRAAVSSWRRPSRSIQNCSVVGLSCRISAALPGPLIRPLT